MGTCGSFFVTRAKKNTLFRRLYSSPVDKALGLRSDQRGVLCGVKARNQYPAHIRRVTYRDPKTDKRLCFLTNSLAIPAIDVCKLYKMRWQVELFFKWVKQHLRIKAFFGTSENAVKTQIWIALSVYVLVAIVRKRLALDVSLYKLLQVLSVTLFEKTPISTVVLDVGSQFQDVDAGNQLTLFNL